ncbi:efflux transporter, RND family, MFP subunit [Methylobacterium sp. 4-46]|uniref:efflux RND transporter periplasmic adaptor subunit n=1 Tax=unclassified Methylobacterium TaxID=2615210 RepID=UPI000152D252|nr:MULTISPECIES: efflux RND transporter periplasmic adaptor subunit [Methylobacterium]ACA14760.1 efflux transporter, RND family, MFP subunit [Methylobacterium sp. 4-46]WFT80512.1 efflux RND transporter periplasmic adaptor subunit [Methylobacterium nodulans]
MPPHIPAALPALAVALALLTGPACAHEGHDHGASPPPVSKTMAPRGEAASAAFELVAVPKNGTLHLYLDRFATDEPVRGATLTVETPTGSVDATAAADGTYQLLAPWLQKPGHFDLMITVTAGEDVDVLPLALDLRDPHAQPAAPAGPVGTTEALSAAVGQTVPAVAQGLKARLIEKDPVLVAVAGGAFLLGILATLLARGHRRVPVIAVLAITATVLLSATAFAHGDGDHGHPESQAALMPSAAHGAAGADLAQRLPDGSVFVPKPTQRLLELRTVMTAVGSYRRTVGLPGRIIPNPNASGVVQSSVGGRLSQPPSGQFPRLGTPVKKGDVLAFVTPPVQRVDVSDMRQRQGELDQQIATVQRRVERYTKLASSGAVSQVQLDEAQDELKGLHDRRAALDKVRTEPEALVAPVSGVIAEASAVAGQMANPGQMVFQIVDPKSLWVEALSFDALGGAENATARLADGRSLTLTYQGSGLADRNQAIPVQFAISGDTGGLRVGQFVTVLAATTAELQGLALPRAAVVRTGNGQDVVYAHTTAERFEARPVRVEPLDGSRVLIAAGVGAGTRVVTQGAELLDQVR